MKKTLDSIEHLILQEKEKSYKEGLSKGISIVKKIIAYLRPANRKNEYAHKVAEWAEKELEILHQKNKPK